MNIQGKHAFITGAGKRLGRAMAETLLKAGANLTAHYRTSAQEVTALQRWASEQKLGKVFPVQAELGKIASLKEAVDRSVKELGAIDILINSASDFYPTPVLQVSEDQWDALMDINLKGQFFLAQAAAISMLANGGIILNLTDLHGEKPLKNYTPYVISKAGLLMLTRNLAKEWAPKIRVNSISPGPVLLPEHYNAVQIDRAKESTLLKRLGSPQDITEAMLFLIRNDYITGLELRVDGGRSLTG